MTVLMAVVDFIPVLLFLAAALLLWGWLRGKMKPAPYAMFCAGTVLVFLAGTLKAVWKLLIAAGGPDIALLSAQFLPVQALGFLLTGAAMLLFVFAKKTAARAMAPWKLVSIAGMVLGVLFTCGGLAITAFRRRKRIAGILFLLAFVLLLGMGYLGTRDVGTDAGKNWTAQFVNLAAQGSLLAGVLLLRRG